MPTINIVKPFTLTRRDGSVQTFGVGAQEFSDEDAKHWYVLAHSDDPPDFEPPNGTPEYAQKQAAIGARRRLLEAAAEEQANAAAVDVRARRAADPEGQRAEESEAAKAQQESAAVVKRGRRPSFTPPTQPAETEGGRPPLVIPTPNTASAQTDTAKSIGGELTDQGGRPPFAPIPQPLAEIPHVTGAQVAERAPNDESPVDKPATGGKPDSKPDNKPDNKPTKPPLPLP